MGMKQEDQEFIGEMIRELDETIRKLVAEERRLADKLGLERVAELKEFWHKQMAPEDEEAFKLSLDHEDKKLTWIWFRLKRIHTARAQAGQALMKMHMH